MTHMNPVDGTPIIPTAYPATSTAVAAGIAKRDHDKYLHSDCASIGHDYTHMINSYGELLRVVCIRCQRSWNTEEVHLV